jgi:hypothetical protein
MTRRSNTQELIRKAPRVRLPRETSRDALADFLSGRGDHSLLLHALFDDVLDEPVPRRLSTMLRRQD